MLELLSTVGVLAYGCRVRRGLALAPPPAKVAFDDAYNRFSGSDLHPGVAAGQGT
jgi:hypothetical protein